MFSRRRFSAAPVPTGSVDGTHAPGSPATAPTPRRDFLARAAAAVGGGLLALAGRPALPQGDQARAATAGFDPFIGEIMIFAGNFAPNGWAFCHGQLLPIASNTALFSLIGTMYGGNGVSTFALPDLRGRVPINFGQGPGLPDFTIGEQAGEYAHTLSVNEMPSHSHAQLADDGSGTQSSPNSALPARDPSGSPAYGTNLNTTMAPTSIGPSGGTQPHNNMPPYLTLNFCIALEGIYPPRS